MGLGGAVGKRGRAVNNKTDEASRIETTYILITRGLWLAKRWFEASVGARPFRDVIVPPRRLCFVRSPLVPRTSIGTIHWYEPTL